MALPWLRAFLVTVLVEAPVVLVLLRRSQPLPRLLALFVFANLATHPIVWFVFPALDAGWPGLAAAEVFAVVAEGLFYRLVLPAVTTRRAWAAALLANALSFGVGLALYRAFAGWLLS